MYIYITSEGRFQASLSTPSLRKAMSTKAAMAHYRCTVQQSARTCSTCWSRTPRRCASNPPSFASKPSPSCRTGTPRTPGAASAPCWSGASPPFFDGKKEKRRINIVRTQQYSSFKSANVGRPRTFFTRMPCTTPRYYRHHHTAAGFLCLLLSTSK